LPRVGNARLVAGAPTASRGSPLRQKVFHSWTRMLAPAIRKWMNPDQAPLAAAAVMRRVITRFPDSGTSELCVKPVAPICAAPAKDRNSLASSAMTQPIRQVRRQVAIQDSGQCDACNSKTGCEIRDRDARVFEDTVAQDFTRMRGIMHLHRQVPV
jgi:hypothetical protein